MTETQERSKYSRKQRKISGHYSYATSRFRGFLKKILERVPILGPLMIGLWQRFNSFVRNIIYFVKKMAFRFNHRKSPLTMDEIHATYYLSPKEIIYSSLVEYSFENGKGLILNGDWDKLEKRFEDLDVYVAFEEVILGKKKWKDTVFYQRIVDRIEKGEVIWGCAKKSDFDERCENLNNLIISIMNHGYKSQVELDTNDLNHEVTINIGRSGDLLFSNGAHRLSIAKILGIEKIPVRIAVRHSDWVLFRKQYEKLSLGRDLKAYQPSIHPDLQHVPTHHDCVDRYVIIKEHLTEKKGRLLDIGANLGYFCFMFEEEGFECVAVENSPNYVFLLNGLKKATSKKFRIISESVLDSKDVLDKPYDVVLALNIFHHFLKSGDTFEKLGLFLANLSCKEMYFEPHLFADPQMENAFINMHEQEFAKYVQTKLRHNYCELIGKASDDRPIYKIW